MWRCGLPWDREQLESVRADYEFDIDALGKDFITRLDAALPEEHKLPRHDDETINLNPRTEGSIKLGTKIYAGFNLNSSKQLIDKLTHILGKVPVDADGKPSASRQALRSYAADHEVVQIYLEWKKAEKRRQMCTSLLDHQAADGFVRAGYMQLGADTGRMSCRNPNNQQIPRDESFRSCVKAPDGWTFVDADFAGMELRLMAAIAGDPVMIKAFQDGQDLHSVTAEAIGCDRQIAKSANFGLAYGSGATGLRNYAGATGITLTQERAAEIRTQWLENFSGVKRWQRDNADAADVPVQKGDNPSIRVELSGLRRFLPGDLNRLTVRCNTPIQGAGAAILKVALANIWPKVKEEYAVEWRDLLKSTMEKAEAMWLGDVPALAEAKIGKTWSETH
jgi:DNA polymerase I-like protein with 3'-5' exonuclease and polymerase domains